MSAQTSETLNIKAVNTAPAAETLSDHDQSFFEKDVLSQFRTNLNQLEELNARLHFMVNEVAGLVKKK